MAKVYGIYSIKDEVVKEILHSWPECEAKVKGIKSVYKSFSGVDAAMNWFKIQEGSSPLANKIPVQFELPEDIHTKLETHLRDTNQELEYIMTALITQFLKDNYVEKPKLVLSIKKDRQKQDIDGEIKVELPWD